MFHDLWNVSSFISPKVVKWALGIGNNTQSAVSQQKIIHTIVCTHFSFKKFDGREENENIKTAPSQSKSQEKCLVWMDSWIKNGWEDFYKEITVKLVDILGHNLIINKLSCTRNIVEQKKYISTLIYKTDAHI